MGQKGSKRTFKWVNHGHGVGDFSEVWRARFLRHVDAAIPGGVFPNLLNGSGAIWAFT